MLSVQVETEFHLYNANSHPNTSNMHAFNVNETNFIAVAQAGVKTFFPVASARKMRD